MQITLTTFNKEDHLPIMAMWSAKRSRPLMDADLIPNHGWIAYNETKMPVGAATLLRIDTPYAIINNLVTNPDAPGQEREAAINMIIEALANDAKEFGCKIVGYGTNVAKMVPRCENLGFTVYDSNITVLGRKL